MKETTWNRVCKALAIQETIPPITNEKKITSLYTYWRYRVLGTLFVGYGIFYFCRKNLSAVMVPLGSELGYSKTQLGILWSVLYLTYGLSKFANGVLGDRSNPRYFMAIGLVLSALANIFFGMSTSLAMLAVFWGLNGWFQGMGWPPCARSLTQWYTPKERGFIWGLWNASHQIGGAGILILAAWLAQHYGWRYAFYVPAVIALVTAGLIIIFLRDHPQSMGLPAIEVYRHDKTGQGHDLHGIPIRELLFKHVLNNKYIWFIAIGNFFVYVVRFGTIDWMPMYLVEAKGSSLTRAGGTVAAFEIMGIIGAIVAGTISDKLFKTERGPVNTIFMALLVGALFLFWWVPSGHAVLDVMALAWAGFLIYGPQILTSVHSADIAGKHAAATATGFVGLMGYMGSLLSGAGTGWLVDHFGWNGGFIFFIVCSFLGIFFFALTWKVPRKCKE
jgi:phosphoglycerate transporter family protein